MIAEFSLENLDDFAIYGRITALRFNCCIVKIGQITAQIGTGECFLHKIGSDDNKEFGPFIFTDPIHRIKALMSVLQNDPHEKDILAKLVILRMRS